jgi:hypothetical protein
MTAVGWKARERKWERGNQYQYWVNTSMPTTPSMFVWPVLHTTFFSVFAENIMQTILSCRGAFPEPARDFSSCVTIFKLKYFTFFLTTKILKIKITRLLSERLHTGQKKATIDFPKEVKEVNFCIHLTINKEQKKFENYD